MYKPYLKWIYAVCAIIPGEHKKSSLRKQAALIDVYKRQIKQHLNRIPELSRIRLRLISRGEIMSGPFHKAQGLIHASRPLIYLSLIHI